MRNWKLFLMLVICIVFVALIITFASNKKNDEHNSPTTGSQAFEGQQDGDVAGVSSTDSGDYVERLAKSLSEEGMILYGSYQSEQCNDQKELFGAAAKYLDYVECDASGANANPDECLAQGVENYPTWIYNGQKYIGEKTLADLAKIIDFK